MDGELFTTADLDPELIEKERNQIERERKAKAKEKEEQKKKEKREDNTIYDKTLFIVDGYAFIYRSYYAHKSKPLTDREGNNISAYYGFFQTLFYLLDNYKMDGLVVAMDTKEPTFRHEMYSEYKASREKAPDDLHNMVEPIKSTLKKMGVPVLTKVGYEADDVIATVAERANKEGWNVVIVTGDKDICQLVSPHISVLTPPKKDKASYTILDREKVKDEYGVYPEQIVDYLSICGDKADNVPGVAGLGEKTASRLLTEYVTLDGIYRHLDSLKPSEKKKLEDGKESAYFSKKLILLSLDAFPEDLCFENTLTKNFTKSNASDDFKRMNINRLNGKLISSLLDEKKDPSNVTEEKEEEVVKPLLNDSEKYLLEKGEYTVLSKLEDVEKDFGNIVLFNDGVLSLFILASDYSNGETVLGFSYSVEPKKATYVSVGEGGGITLDEMKILFEKYFSSGKIKIIAHSGEAILRLLFTINLDATIISDTMIMAWLLSSNDGVYSLNSVVSKYFSQTLLDLKDIKGGDRLENVDISLLSRYSLLRSDYTSRLNRVLERRIHERELFELYRTMELPLLEVLARMESEGIYLSKERMDELKAKTDERIAKLEEAIYLLAGYKFNINSTMQLSKLLYDERKLPPVKKTARGFSTDTETLEALKSTEDPIIALLLEYRQLAKLKSTYIDVLPLLRDSSGRVHTSFLQTGTATGRLSSRNPNLQNIPVRTDEGRLIRSAFVPESGNVFISADYSQIELVVLSWLSDDEMLKSAFLSGEDVHRFTAALVFNKKSDDVTSQERRVAKTINFGIMYGMSAFRLSNELGISRSEAKEFITRYFERYSSVKDFVEKVNREAEKNGYVKTYWGHEREILGINSRNKTEKAAAERTAVNTVIQGTAAEIMKKAMIEIFNEIKEKKINARMLLQVHDELIFEVEESKAEELELLIKDKMENVAKLSVPLRVSVERGHSWGEMHE